MSGFSFNFSTAQHIIFGTGSLQTLPNYIKDFGERVLLVTGKKYPDPSLLLSLLEDSGHSIVTFSVSQEPDINLIQEGVACARGNDADFILGFGGGAVVDTGKAIAALSNNDGEIFDYLEVVGKGLPLSKPSLPYVAIPTTAGTGSEVTKNAVISIPEKKVKVSLRNEYLLPDVALVDPALTLSVPREVTASTGMDAFTQVIEPYVTRINNPMVDIFCREAIPIAAKNLSGAYRDGADIKAREKMAYVSLLGGLSLANAKLGAVHGFAGPIGGMFDAPHGMICAALLPSVMQINAQLLSKSINQSEKLKRFREIARWVTGIDSADVSDGIKWISNLAHDLNVPGLAHFGVNEKDFPAIIKKAQHSSSMKGNPIELKDTDMMQILSASL